MEELLEEKLLRHYKTLRYLISRKWVTTYELSRDLRLSGHTIKKDIGEINDYLFPAKIETSLKLGIRLSYPDHLNTFFIISKIYQQSSNFLVMEEIFLSNYSNLAQLADKLFLSESTLKRRIEQLNKTLKKFDIFIDSYRIDVKGNEKMACWFYFYYLTEKYFIIDSFISADELCFIDELITEFLAAFPTFNTSDRRRFSYRNKMRIMLFITIKRLEKKNTFQFAEKMDTRGFCLSDRMKKQLLLRYGIVIDDTVTFHLFYIFFNYRFAWTTKELTAKAKQCDTISEIQEVLCECLNQIELQEKIIIPNKDAVLLHLYNALSYSWGPAKILYHPSEEFFANLNTYYCSFTNRIKMALDANLAKHKLSFYYDKTTLNRIAFMLITSWRDLGKNLEIAAPTVKAGLFFYTSYEHSQFLLDDIAYHLKSRLDIETIEVSTIAELRDSSKKYDIIITNLSALDLENCPVVSIHPNPTPEDLKAILFAYNAVIKTKADNDSLTVEKTNSIYSLG